MTPFEMGYNQGKKGNFVSRGLMRFGLSCAIDYYSSKNAADWLKGFEKGFKEAGYIDPTLLQFVEAHNLDDDARNIVSKEELLLFLIFHHQNDTVTRLFVEELLF